VPRFFAEREAAVPVQDVMTKCVKAIAPTTAAEDLGDLGLSQAEERAIVRLHANAVGRLLSGRQTVRQKRTSRPSSPRAKTP
jgi:hypothetical protein